MPNEKGISELISDTENLVQTLTNLNNEIESYNAAKANLIETRKDLSKFIEDFDKVVVKISEYLNQIQTLVNDDYASKMGQLISQFNVLKNQHIALEKNIQQSEQSLKNDLKTNRLLLVGIIVLTVINIAVNFIK